MNKGVLILKCVLLAILAILAMGTVTMLLWNWLVPLLFKGPEITFLQTLGLLLLSKLLFWSFGGKHHSHGNAPYWKKGFYEKFSDMTPEQRQAFKQKMKDKWCRWEQTSSNPEDNDTDKS